MSGLSIVSANCQGLGHYEKRRDVFQFLRTKKASVYFLQDTHFTKKDEKQIRSEWGYECLFASFSSQSRGVCILFNNNFDFKIKYIDRDPNGNYLIAVINTMEKNIVLLNLYGPNNDDPQFYITLQQKLESMGYNDIIIGGDWNLVMNPALDYHNYKHNNNTQAQEQVAELSGELDLIDVWREINPETLRYTWRRHNQRQQARLDFFLVSENLLSNVKEADINIAYRSDHSSISINLEFKKEEKTHNFWKFNSSLLRDKQYVNEVNKIISEIKQQYASLVYNRDNIENIPSEDLEFMISDQLFLDTLLMEIRKKTMDFSGKKKKQEQIMESQYETEIKMLEEKRDKTEEEILTLHAKKESLVDLRKTKMQGILLRSKARWANEGEKITKYFCNLEKRHFVSKQMFKIISKNGKCLENRDDMLKETREFYQNLYADKEVEEIDLENFTTTLPKLRKEEAAMLEGTITLEEASIALKKMSNGKSPGTDGMTVDFFKFFWKQLGIFVVRSLNEGFINKQMSITQREGIIVCLPKGDKPREFLKNWRPISLLNVTYKIGSSCISNRIKTVLPNLINEDQSGFVSGRYIGDNLRLLYDITHYLQNKQMPGLLVSLDFEKAFDSINWKYMHQVLKVFGFGEDICQWILAFYSNIKSSVIVNGKASQNFDIKRGCRQGDPISPYLFILCAELLACKIRENKNIKGIQIQETECKISQFADDTTLLLEGDRESYEDLFHTLDQFERISGLKINYDKTCNVWLGSKINSNVEFMQHLHMTWNPQQYKILGLWYTNNLERMAELNLTDKFNETKKLFSVWMKRSITPLGKVAVLKSLVLSKLTYLWIMLPNPPQEVIKKLQLLCYEFIWDKKIDKVKRTVAIHCIENGGIGVPEIKAFIKSLKLSWLKKCCNPNYSSKWKTILLETVPVDLINVYGPRVLLSNQQASNLFWRDVFQSYLEFYNKVDIDSPELVLLEPLFCNDKFKIDGSVFDFKTWAEAGIFAVKDLVQENGKFYSYENFKLKFQIQVPLLKYYGCISSIRKYLRKTGITFVNNDCNHTNYNKAYNILIKAPKGTKAFYNIFIGEPTIPNPCKNWEDITNTEIDWTKIFTDTKKITEVKLKWFQLKINYRILVTNSMLCRMKIMNTNVCSFCNVEKDTIFHYLWECNHVQSFWNELVNYMKENCTNCDRLQLNAILVLFGNDNKTTTDTGFRHILLAAKFFVYKCRINKIKPIVQMFLQELSIIYKTDQYVYNVNMKYNEFVKKWASYQQMLPS
jgi:exonuclease III